MDKLINNPHFQRVAAELLEVAHEKERIEQCFSLEVADDYIIIKQKLVELVAELLKADIAHELREDSIVLRIQEESVSVPQKSLKQYIGEEEYEFFITHRATTAEVAPTPDDTSGVIMLLNSIQKEKEALAEENRRLLQSNKDLKKAAQNNSNESLQQQITALKNDNLQLKNKTDALTEKNKTLSVEYDVLEKKYKELVANNKEAELSAKIKTLQEENEQLSRLAYYDQKTGVYNSNAFNRDFHEMEPVSTIFIMTSICKMRLLNEVFGRENGDNAILQVATELSALFPYGKIYRVMGDKFNVLISSDISCNDVYSAVANLKKKLESSKIEIVFGVASGITHPQKADIIRAAESMLNEMKSGNKVDTQTKWKTEEEPKAEEEPATTELNAEALMAQYLDEVD